MKNVFKSREHAARGWARRNAVKANRGGWVQLSGVRPLRGWLGLANWLLRRGYIAPIIPCDAWGPWHILCFTRREVKP